MNGIDTFVREAMPTQEEEEASGTPAARARPILKPTSTSGWDFTPMEQRKHRNPRILFVFKCQNSSLGYFDTVKKFIEKLMEFCETVVDEWKKKLSDDTGYLSDEMKKQFANAPCWSIENGFQFWQKVEDRRKVSIVLEPEVSSSIPVLSSNPRTLRKHTQFCIARQCTATRRFYRVYLSRRKRKRIEVNSEPSFDSRRSQSQNRQTSCVLHCSEPDG